VHGKKLNFEGLKFIFLGLGGYWGMGYFQKDKGQGKQAFWGGRILRIYRKRIGTKYTYVCTEKERRPNFRF